MFAVPAVNLPNCCEFLGMTCSVSSLSRTSLDYFALGLLFESDIPGNLYLSSASSLQPSPYQQTCRASDRPTQRRRSFNKTSFYSRLDLGLSAFSPFRAITTKNVCRSFLDQVSSGKSSGPHERSDGAGEEEEFIVHSILN